MSRAGVFRSLGTWAVAGATLLSALPTAAQTPIAVGDRATWSQEDSAFRIPPEISGFARTDLVDYGDQRLNVSATYQDPQTETTATLYLFRAPLPDVAIWHDRALASIVPHPTLGTPAVAAAVTKAFAPPGTNGVASGLQTVMPLAGTAFRSTAIALFPHGEWLVKVRMSSRTLDPAQLPDKLHSFITALSYDARGAAQAVTRMADCAESLKFRDSARAEPPSMAAQLILPMLSNLASENVDETSSGALTPGPTAFCRDRSSQLNYGVYRPTAADDWYVMALGDAGVSAAVRRLPAAEFLETDANSYVIDLSTPDATALYRGFRALPPPAQVLQVLQSEQPVSSMDRKGTLTVSQPPSP